MQPLLGLLSTSRRSVAWQRICGGWRPGGGGQEDGVRLGESGRHPARGPGQAGRLLVGCRSYDCISQAARPGSAFAE